MTEIKYRGYTIRLDPPPIPTRQFDWQYCHDDYDGPPDSRCGAAASAPLCIVEIDEIESDMDEIGEDAQ